MMKQSDEVKQNFSLDEQLPPSTDNNSNNNTNNTKSRIRKRKSNFITLSNSFLRDKRLSFKAKGLFAYMYSFDESWNFTLNSISKQQEEGIYSIRSAINELKIYGYIVYKKFSNGTGIYYLDDEPHFSQKIKNTKKDEEIINTIEDKEQNEMTNNRHNKKQTPRYLEKPCAMHSLLKENIDNKQKTNITPQDIIQTYKELISTKYEDVSETRSFNQILLSQRECFAQDSEHLEAMLKGIKNYSKALKLKQKKPEKLFFFIKDKIYLDYQNEQTIKLSKNEVIVPEELIGLKFTLDGEEIEFLEDGYYKIQKDWKVTNAKDVSDMVELIRNFFMKQSNKINSKQGDKK